MLILGNGMIIPDNKRNVTCGNKLLVLDLTWVRASKASAYIPDPLRKGRILDIGCDYHPSFLSHDYFKEKYAIDRQVKPDEVFSIICFPLDLNSEPHIPLEDKYFEAMTRLAVTEHINQFSLVKIFRVIHRRLLSDGMLVVTTMEAWSGSLLHLLSRVKMVGKEEIDEHVPN